MDNIAMIRPGTKTLAALLFIGAVVIFNQGWLPTHDQDSMMFAVIARNIAETGDWVTLSYTKLYYPQFYEHPPLFYWLQGAIFALLGFSHFAMRLVSGMFGLLGLWAVYAYGARWRGPWTGFWAGFIMLWSFRYFNYASKCRLDVPLTAALAIGGYCLLRALDNPRWLVPAGAATGIALLIKGPLGLALLPVALVGFLLCGRWRVLVSRYAVLGVLVLLLVPAPWVVRQLQENGDALYREYLLKQVWQTATSGREKDIGSPFYYLGVMVKQYWPWLLALLPGIYGLVRERRNNLPGMLAMAWAVVILAGLSVVAGKREYYILPAAPPLALLSAYALDHWLRPAWRKRALCFVLAAAVLYAVLGVTPLEFRKYDAGLMDLMRAVAVAPPPGGILLAYEAPKKKWSVIAFAALYGRCEAREVGPTELYARLRAGEELAIMTAPDREAELDEIAGPLRWQRYGPEREYALGYAAGPGGE